MTTKKPAIISKILLTGVFAFSSSFVLSESYALIPSYDLNSHQILEGHFSDSENVNSPLAEKILLAYQLLNCVDNNIIDLKQPVKVESHSLSGIDRNKAFFLQKDQPITVEDLINGLLFLHSEETSRISKDFLKELQQNKKVNHNINLTELGYIDMLDQLLQTLQKHKISVFQPSIKFQEQNFPSRVRKIESEHSETVIFHQPGDYFCLAISFIKNKKYPANVRKVISVNFSPNTEDVINKASHSLFRAVNNYETARIFSSGEKISATKTVNAKEKSVNLITPRDIYVTIAKNDIIQNENKKNTLSIIVEKKELIKAPFSSSEPFGKVNIVLKGKVIKTFPLYPQQQVDEEKSPLVRTYRTFEKIFKRDYGKRNQNQ